MSKVWAELKRRNIFRVAAAYVVVSWIILQVASLVAPALDLPGWVVSFVLFILVIGFPLALIFAWAFELTPEGLRRSVDVDPDHSMTKNTGRTLDFIIIGILSTALVFFIADRVFSPRATPTEVIRSSIAVLPFVNMSSDPEQEYFSDGISEELLNLLSRTKGLRVAARTSSFMFKDGTTDVRDIGAKLDVATILEGSVRQSGKRIRITAQLNDVETGYHLWSGTFDRDLTDIFVIQDEISHSIVAALHDHLGLKNPEVAKAFETDVEAYRLYLLGRHNFEQREQETLYRAVGYFEKAIAIDPNYAPAYSGMADAWMLLSQTSYGDLPDSSVRELAGPLIKKALELDPGLAEAHASQGLLYEDLLQFEVSLQSLDRAIELNPNLARAWHWKAVALQGFVDQAGALECWRRAHALDPLSPTILGNLSMIRMRFGQFDEAMEVLERFRSASPDTRNWGIGIEILVPFMQGDWASAHIVLARMRAENPDEPPPLMMGYVQLALNAFDGRKTRYKEIDRIRLNSYTSPSLAWREYETLAPDRKDNYELTKVIAVAVSRLGKHEAVIELLESLPGYAEGSPGPLISSDFVYNSSAPLLALAMRQTGDEIGARRLMSTIGQSIHNLKEQGATWTLPILEAKFHVLERADDTAIDALKQAHLEGYLYWYDLQQPIFDSIRDREDFQAIVRSVDAKVNEERAKLGWEPVE